METGFMIKRPLTICLFVVSMLFLAGCVFPDAGKSSNETGTVVVQPKINATDLPTLIGELKKCVVHINYSGNSYDEYWGEEDFEIIGSGVIYSVDGSTVYVITNRHVADLNYPDYYGQVRDEKIVVRTFSDDRFSVEQRMVAPERIDLAILKFTKGPQNITSASMAAALPKVGQEVIVIGMPEYLDWSVSKGIVSGIRSFDPEEGITGKKYTAVQTDAAINSGNSGGGMFSTDGLLVGVNTWKYIGFGVEGLNFAVSSVDFISLKQKFSGLPLVTAWNQPAAGNASSIGLVDVSYDYEYDSSGSLEATLTLMDRYGYTTSSDGRLGLVIQDGNGNLLYNKTTDVKGTAFKARSGYPFYGKSAYTLKIPYSEVNESETSYAYFTFGFSGNSTTFRKKTDEYLPYALQNYSDSHYGDYSSGDYWDDDYWYDDYSYSEDLKSLNASSSQDEIEVSLAEGGFIDDYYSPYYVVDAEFRNKGSSKKEIEIKDAVLVMDGKQFNADFWYGDEDLGSVYPNAAVGRELEFYGMEKPGSSATLYIELRVIEGNSVKTVDLQVDFTP